MHASTQLFALGAAGECVSPSPVHARAARPPASLEPVAILRAVDGGVVYESPPAISASR